MSSLLMRRIWALALMSSADLGFLSVHCAELRGGVRCFAWQGWALFLASMQRTKCLLGRRRLTKRTDRDKETRNSHGGLNDQIHCIARWRTRQLQRLNSRLSWLRGDG